MKPIYYCSIPNRCPSKKNTKKFVRNHGRVNVIYSAQFREWEKTAIIHMRQAHIGMDVIDEPIEAKFTFYFKNHHAEADVSNIIEAPQDALKKAGVISDDKLIQVIHAQKIFGEEPRCVIQLFAIETTTEEN